MINQIRVLIVDDDRRIASTLGDILSLQGAMVEQANSGKEAVQKLRSDTFDCVLSDIKMPGMNGVELYEAVNEIQPGIPFVLMTAYASDELIEKGRRLGVLNVFEKPLDINQILCFLSSVQETRTIVIVDDDPLFCQTLSDILEARRYRVQKISDPHVAAQVVDESAQLVLLDMKLNSINGSDVLKQIRTRFPDMPAVLVTGYRQEMAEAIRQAMDMQVYTCLYKPLSIPDLFKILVDIRSDNLLKSLGEGETP